MKNRLFGMAITGLAAAVLSTGAAFAAPQGDASSEDRPKRERKERGEGGEGAEDGKRQGRQGRGPTRQLYKGIELTDDQKAQAKEIASGLRPQARAWREKVRAASKAVREARKSGDETAIQAAMAKRQEIATNPPILGALDQFRGVLTSSEDQAKFDQNVQAIKQHISDRINERRQNRESREGKEGRGGGDGEGDGKRKKRGGDQEGDDRNLDI